MNQTPACRDQLQGKSEVPMADVLQWIGLAFGIGVVALGVMGFFRGVFAAPEYPRTSCARQGR
jgi:hypothetical protein